MVALRLGSVSQFLVTLAKIHRCCTVVDAILSFRKPVTLSVENNNLYDAIRARIKAESQILATWSKTSGKAYLRPRKNDPFLTHVVKTSEIVTT